MGGLLGAPASRAPAGLNHVSRGFLARQFCPGGPPPLFSGPALHGRSDHGLSPHLHRHHQQGQWQPHHPPRLQVRPPVCTVPAATSPSQQDPSSGGPRAPAPRSHSRGWSRPHGGSNLCLLALPLARAPLPAASWWLTSGGGAWTCLRWPGRAVGRPRAPAASSTTPVVPAPLCSTTRKALATAHQSATQPPSAPKLSPYQAVHCCSNGSQLREKLKWGVCGGTYGLCSARPLISANTKARRWGYCGVCNPWCDSP